jgi:hypothetical protein
MLVGRRASPFDWEADMAEIGQALTGQSLDPTVPTADVAPGWLGSPDDKMRAMNLLRRKSLNEPIEPDASEWLDQYMKFLDRSLPPIKGR